MQSEINVIIPTYNAANSIVETIRSVLLKQPKSHIIIVDDNSPDKTAELIKKEFIKNSQVEVLLRNGKGGRGAAVIAGLKKALDNKKVKYFIEMDADLCHDPKYISELISKCKKADMVIVSKYLPQSTISGVTFKRNVMSQLMNIAARVILQVPITDYSNGYRCYTRPVVEFICKLKFKSKGFVVLSEIVYRVHKRGFKIAEIPFDFRRENSDKSNMNFEEVKEAILTLMHLRFSKYDNK